MRRTFAFLLLAAATLVAPACTTNPATGQSSFTGFMSPEDEKRVGAQEHPKLVQQFGGDYADSNLAAYVNRVGQAVAKHAEVQDVPYTFTVLDDDDINAFALPGGYVHVTRGLVTLASNERNWPAFSATRSAISPRGTQHSATAAPPPPILASAF